MSVDWLGFGFVALSLGCLQIVLDRGQDDDWFGSTLITTLAVTSAVAFVLLIYWELRHPRPMVEVRLLRRPEFAVTFFLMLMLGFMIFGSTFLIPAYAQQLMGYRAVDAGMVLTPGGLATIALLPLVGRLINKVDTRLLIAIGLALGGVSLLWMTDFYLGVSFGHMMWMRILQMASMAFLFVPINTLAFPLWEILSEMPPNHSRSPACMPSLPTTMIAASVSPATASTASTGSPSGAWVVTSTPRFAASAVARASAGSEPSPDPAVDTT